MSYFLKIRLKKADYNQPKYLILQSFASSMLIVFYSTKQSFFKSLLNPTHLITFGMTFFLMFILSMGLGQISAILDKYFPWHRETRKRYFLQFLLGLVLPAGISLLVVYLLFLKVMDANIFQTAYLRRDYVLLLVSIVGINLFHYYEFHKYLHRISDSMIKSLDERTDRAKEGMEKPPEFQPESFSDKQSYQMAYEESTIKYEIYGSETPIQSNKIGMFFVKTNYNVQKQVFIKLINGQEEMLKDGTSLSNVASRYEYLFIRISRQCLVNRNALGSSKKIDYRTYEIILNIPDTEPCLITSDNYQKLKSMIQSDK